VFVNRKGADMNEIKFDQAALEERIIEQAAHAIAENFFDGQMGDLERRIVDLMEAKTAERCDATVLPVIENGIQDFIVRETNRFGEEKGEPKTFAEYLVGLADDYLMEHVGYDGKPKPKNDYGYRDADTRLTFLIKKHLRHEVENAMKAATKAINDKIAPALAETVKIQAKDVVAKLTQKQR